MSEDLKDDALDAAYRQASEAEAGRAPAAARAAILAEARAAAERRRPAANDARYWMSAVAGIAVVSIGVVLWRQTGDEFQMPGSVPEPITVQIQAEAPEMDRHLPPVLLDMPPPSEALEAGLPEEPVDDAVKAAPAPATSSREDSDAQQAFGTSASRQEKEESAARTPPVPESVQAAAQGEAPRLPMPAAPPPPPPPPQVTRSQSAAEVRSQPRASPAEADESEELAETVVTGTRILRPTDPMELLRREFPEQYRSGNNHRLWLVLDATGAVRMKGELRAGQQLEDLAPQIARELGSAAGPWQVERLENSRTRIIELGIARLP